jgi:hypothetical protein
MEYAFTVSDADYENAARVLKGRRPAQHVVERLEDPELETIRRYINERIIYLQNDQTLHLLFDGDYQIALTRIQTPADLLNWVYYLLGKPWIDTHRIRVVIERVSQVKRFRLHGDLE